MAYASNTKVSSEKSKYEIERLVMRHGADNFANFTSKNEAKIAFEYQGKRIVFSLPLPDPDDEKYHYTEAKHRKRSDEAAYASWEQDCRSKWRSLLLTIKAKLESIDAGIETFEEAFLAHIMTPDGKRFGDVAIPQITQAIKMKRALPPLLGGG